MISNLKNSMSFGPHSSSRETRQKKKTDSEMLRAVVMLGRKLIAE
jgi:hypothetical protein